MPGLDLGKVSSNWKKLQEQLKPEKTQQPQTRSNGLKRKRPEEKRTQLSGSKKAKLPARWPEVSRREQKMGAGESKPATNGHVLGDQAKLVNEHGIAAEDVLAAYGTERDSIRRDDDVVNEGLHSGRRIGKYVALDCEMVGTGPPPYKDNLLARVSLVNFYGEQIYDSYVLPPRGEEVGDYRTQYSGIRPHHLRPDYARPFAEVQEQVARLLDGRVLVGHGLRNDMQVLLLSHPKHDTRDTSRHPKFRIDSRGKPPALRNLVRSELGRNIQTGEHSSIEDARAAIMLYRKEKADFEEEDRKRFGQRRRPAKMVESTKNATDGTARASDDEAEENEEDGDLELLDGEDEGLDDDEGCAGDVQSVIPRPSKKKRKKKKKRTKRY